MNLIDSFAYSNRIRKLDPVYKATLCFSVILICLLANKPLIGILSILWVTILAVFWAGLPGGFFLRLLLGEAGFLALGVFNVAVGIGTTPIEGGISVGLIYFVVTPESLQTAVMLLTRSLGCAVAMNFLALTTPLIDLIDLMRRFHLPGSMVDLMTIIYRYIFTLLDCLERMVLAQEVRFGFTNFRNAIHSTALIAANLFIESLRRSQRLQTALEGRGWDGSLHVLFQDYEHPSWPWMGSSIGLFVILLFLPG